jgi:hypothetical protein
MSIFSRWCLENRLFHDFGFFTQLICRCLDRLRPCAFLRIIWFPVSDTAVERFCLVVVAFDHKHIINFSDYMSSRVMLPRVWNIRHGSSIGYCPQIKPKTCSRYLESVWRRR